MDLLQKFRETFASVVPIMAIVVALSLSVAPLPLELVLRFIAGGVLVIVGLALFLLGVDMGILPIGEQSGAALTAKRNLPLLLAAAFLIGVMVTIAEPDVQVLADQVKSLFAAVNKWALVFGIALGVGAFVTVGLCRTVLSLNLRALLLVCYIALFALALSSPDELQGAAFDAGGATTGPMTVPFILALGMGVASVRSSGSKDDSSDDDSSFGLTGIASIGPVAAVCIYGLMLQAAGSVSSAQSEAVASEKAGGTGMAVFVSLIPEVAHDVLMSLLPLVILFALFQVFLLKLPPVRIRKVAQGIVYCFVGLVLFLVGANGGFMDAGKTLGSVLGHRAFSSGGVWVALIVAVALVFGAITVCAEPAVWVLTEQVETVSGGNIRRKVMLAALSFGVAAAIALSTIRIIAGFSLWLILIPGYALALALTFFCPPLFTGIAFDSGGVASGPMTSTFILSFTIGAASSSTDGAAAGSFGVIALVAMTPLIAIQLLGLIYRIKTRKNARRAHS